MNVNRGNSVLLGILICKLSIAKILIKKMKKGSCLRQKKTHGNNGHQAEYILTQIALRLNFHGASFDCKLAVVLTIEQPKVLLRRE